MISFQKLKRKVSTFPLVLVLLGFVSEFVYQSTCGACAQTGSIRGWQVLLDQATPILWVSGSLLLLLSFFREIIAIVKDKNNVE